MLTFTTGSYSPSIHLARSPVLVFDLLFSFSRSKDLFVLASFRSWYRCHEELVPIDPPASLAAA
uniref:Uncharacterized protein n=1 Tax=Triticum urartu TaxID=4572 RepID=A0A8R7TAW8_TRIUA